MKGHFAAIALILFGSAALAVNLDLVEIDFARLARTWWPLLPIALGVALFFTPVATASHEARHETTASSPELPWPWQPARPPCRPCRRPAHPAGHR